MTRDPSAVMREFWDAKARENATYYISSYRPYDAQDDAEFWAWGETLTARLLEESGLSFTGRERVLDIGCGIGRMTVPLARRFREVVGVDVSREMVRRARGALAPFPNAGAEVVSGTDLGAFPAQSFDFVFSYLVLQHVPQPALVRGYLLEIARVLRPGGAFHVQVNGEPERREPLAVRLRGAASRALRALLPGSARGPRGLESPAWRGCRVSLETARAFLGEAGLDLERARGEGTQYLWLTGHRREAAR